MPFLARRRRAALAVPLGLAALAVLPAAATAATVTVSGSSLTFNAGSGEPNALKITKSGGNFRVVDTGATAVTANAGCTQVSPRIASCPVGAVTVVNAYLWDQDDTAVFSGDTAARLYGYKGRDDLTGGSGADTLDAGTGTQERLVGRGGNDTLTAATASGTNYLFGGDGNDRLTGATTSNVYSLGLYGVMDGGAGDDRLVGSVVNDALTGGTGADTLDGQGGLDVASYEGRSEPLNIDPMDGAANDGGASDGPAGARDKVSSNVEGSVGGTGNDVLKGTPSNDVLLGGSGDDTLDGGSGDDALCGDGSGSVDPTGTVFTSCFGGYSGPGGADTLNGGAGRDQLTGNGRADVLNGGSGFDVANWFDRGTSVVATIDDCAGASTCAVANDGAVDEEPWTEGLQPENDRVGTDVEGLSGGSGDDVLSGSDADNELSGHSGNDVLDGLDGDDILCGDRYEYPLSFGAPYGTDSCANIGGYSGSSFSDTLDGGAGDDLLNGNVGADSLTGGTGRDAVSYHDRTSPGPGVVATIDDTCEPPAASPCALANDGAADADAAQAGDQPEGDTIERDVENLIGTGGDDTLSGSATVNVLSGNNGTDTLNGLAAGDVLEPGGGSGDVVNGNAGSDYASYRPAPSSCPFCYAGGVNVSLDGVANDGPMGESDNIKTDVEGVLGTDQTDVITGQANSTANTFLGYAGSDTLTGNGGNDALDGGRGFDTLAGSAGDDVLDSADGESDASVDCGDGAGDRAVYDDGLETPSNCETLDPETVSAFASAAKVSGLVAVQHELMRR